MAVNLPAKDAEALLEYEPEEYYAVWQHPEGRYAYSVSERREGWLIVLGSEEPGQTYLLSDARMNGRESSQYRLDELTLPEAFAAVRAQRVPFVSSHGFQVLSVRGVVLIAKEASRVSVRHIPL